MKLDGKVAIVTGCSRGLGKEIGLCLAREGANVVVNYKEASQQASEVTELIKGLGRRAFSFRADVSKYQEVEAMVSKTIKEFGKVDILVNNAGINQDTTIANMESNTWENVIAVNMTGAFNCTKAVLTFMRDAGFGRIINISSVVGQTGSAGASNYAASKAGLIGFTKAIAREVARKGITVNALALGYIDIGMGQRLSREMKDNVLKQILVSRFGKPEEVGYAVVFLASDEAGYITGEVINVNGGVYL